MQAALVNASSSLAPAKCLSKSQAHSCVASGTLASRHRCRPLAQPVSARASVFTGSPLVIRRPRDTMQAHATPSRSGMPVQANLLNRFGRVVRSYTFFYSESAMKELEDPLKLLDQAVTDMQTDLIKMRQAAAQVTGAEKQMEAQYRAAAEASDQWRRRAEWALRRDDEELAREALKRRKTFETMAQTLKGQLQQHSKATATLRANIGLLEGKVAEARSKKETLKARALSAQASKMLNEEITSLIGGLRSSSNSSLAAFARMEQKVEALEAEAEAAGQLGPGGDALEAKFALLEGGSGGVDDELLALKADMLASSNSNGGLPAGRAEPRAYERMPNFERRSTRVDIVWP